MSKELQILERIVKQNGTNMIPLATDFSLKYTGLQR